MSPSCFAPINPNLCPTSNPHHLPNHSSPPPSPSSQPPAPHQYSYSPAWRRGIGVLLYHQTSAYTPKHMVLKPSNPGLIETEGRKGGGREGGSHFINCFPLYTASFFVHGLMMLSEGETYSCFALPSQRQPYIPSLRVIPTETAKRGKRTHPSPSNFDCSTCR